MCGICGAVNVDNAPAIVRLMNRAMVHRGPDSDGFLDAGRVALGMRRLKIIDLQTGDQPIYNEDRTVAIVFNGEIYNFQALYHDLQARGHRFATRSDTEAIVHAYEEWGTDCPRHLRGMFAFAIVDRRPHLSGAPRLFLARDRLGIKPLYVWQSADRLLFASEVRSLLASELVPRQLSPAGLYTYLAFGSVQEPLTLIEGIRSLAPAGWLLCEQTAGGVRVTRETYWEPPAQGAGSLPGAETRVRDALGDAVSGHLISDVPLGAFLSGGLDSGAIVAMASRGQERPLRTFTIGFDNWPGDERHLASLSAQRWQTAHTVRVVSQAELLADLPQAVADMDQPTVDGINTWYVAREARRAGLTVALSGVGGDELFAGYPSFRLVPRLKRLPRAAWLARVPGWDRGWRVVRGNPDSRRKLAALAARQMPFDHPYFALRGLFTGAQIQALLGPDLEERLGREDAALAGWRKQVDADVARAATYDAIGEVSWLELSQYMRSTLLRDSDVMSMAHSLEVRVPFLDHRLVEAVLPIAGRYKLNGAQPKPLLAGAMAGLLPEPVLQGAKRTFTFPFETWVRGGLSQSIGQRLTARLDRSYTWLEPAALAGVWHDFEAGRTNWARPWALHMLDAWLERNLS